MTNERDQWAVNETEDIREVDERRKPSSDAAFKDTDKAGTPRRPGDERGAGGEHEQEPDMDKEAAP